MSAPAEGVSLHWPAPAKLNLFLRIVGRRPDGRHNLQTVFQLLDFGDSIELLPRDDGRIVRHGGLPGLAADDDLAVRAARLLAQVSPQSPGAEITVHKRVPAGGGFGGGSSDAATVLVALNHLWGLQLDIDRLAALGLELGADVPVFIRGRSAWAEGLGDRLTPLELPQRHFLLLDPGVHADTSQLFQAPELTRDAAPATMSGFISGDVAGNAFEPVLRAREPRVDAAFAVLARFGAPQLTGSGSGCFVAFQTRAEAERAAREIGSAWRCGVASGLNRSPLLDRLRRAGTAWCNNASGKSRAT